MSTNTIYSKYFYVYKITNTINNKIYIGVHQSDSLDDTYMGSGIHLKRAQSKYGIENFKKEILFIYDNKEDMFSKEKELVNESFVQDKNTYNLKVGGEGGWDHINNNMTAERRAYLSNIGNQAISYKMKTDPEFKKRLSNQTSINNKKMWEDPIIRESIIKSLSIAKTGTTASEETKAKLKSVFNNIEHQKGTKNSQYGTMWIYSLEEKRNMKINKNDPIPEGWIKGRKTKF